MKPAPTLDSAKQTLLLKEDINATFGNGSGDGKAYCDLEDIFLWVCAHDEPNKQLLDQQIREARTEIALSFIQKLDEAGVPFKVKIPELHGEDLETVSVPIVSGAYWVNVHRALKFMREETEQILAARGADASAHPSKGNRS